MCNCITGWEEFFDGDQGMLVDMLFDKITRRPMSIQIPPWLDLPWFTVLVEREWHEEEAAAGDWLCTDVVIKYKLW
jgi:hypothetical protein